MCAKIQAANHELVDQFRAEHAAWALEVVGIESKIERLKDLYVHQWAGAVVANTVERALVVEEHQRRSAKWSAYKVSGAECVAMHQRDCLQVMVVDFVSLKRSSVQG